MNSREKRKNDMIYTLLQSWAQREYGVPFELAKDRSKGAKEEFGRLESYLNIMWQIGMNENNKQQEK